jgi:serine/threonine protein kinase
MLLNRHQFIDRQKLSEGCYGKIYKAYDTRMGNRPVAIKELGGKV